LNEIGIIELNIMGNSKSKSIQQPPIPPPPRPPKHLLWGCPTTEAHYEYIIQALHKTENLRGAQGLAVLGFEYRMVHAQHCNCENKKANEHNNNDDQSSEEEEEEEASDSLNNSNDKNDNDGEEFNNNTEFLIPIKDPDEPDNEKEINIDKKPEDDNDNDDKLVLSSSALDLLALRYESVMEATESKSHASCYSSTSSSSSRQRRKIISRISSATSLFSLNTHSSTSVFLKFDEWGAPLVNPLKRPQERQKCGFRLFHVPSNQIVSELNWPTLIAPGKLYDVVARLCMETAQEEMMRVGNLEWSTIGSSNSNSYNNKDTNSDSPTTTDTESSSSSASSTAEESSDTNRDEQSGNTTTSEDDDDDDAIRLLTSRQYQPKNPTLLVITGKGQVGAGIFSRRHLLTSGMEVSTALPFVRKAKDEPMNIVMFDPNQTVRRKGQNAMQTVEQSFQYFTSNKEHQSNDIFVLAHSMAGSQLIRYLNNTNHLRERIQAIAFTDSNHNINWVSKEESNDNLLNLIQGPRSLYIKSHKVHEDAKILGELHHDCHFWQHRFGTIRTIWAGTNE